MRTLFYIVLFITPTVLVLIFRQEIQDYLVEKGLLGPDLAEEAPGPGTEPDLEPQPEGEPASPSAPGAEDGDSRSEDAVAASAAEAEIDRQVAALYPLPEFQSLESLVNHWREVPARAFPERVTLKKPMELQLIVGGKVSGKSTLRVGQQAYPVALEGGTLVVSGSAGGDTALQGRIPVDDTDFKEQIQQAYEAWKTRQAGRIHKLRKEEKQRLLAETAGEGQDAPGANAPSAPAASASLLGGEPAVNPDGSVDAMIESIRSGAVEEIELDKIDYWKWKGYEEIGGSPYWTGVVGYRADTLFGEIRAEGKALIRRGKVVKWIYSGSEEEIR